MVGFRKAPSLTVALICAHWRAAPLGDHVQEAVPGLVQAEALHFLCVAFDGMSREDQFTGTGGPMLEAPLTGLELELRRHITCRVSRFLHPDSGIGKSYDQKLSER